MAFLPLCWCWWCGGSVVCVKREEEKTNSIMCREKSEREGG